MRLDPASRQWYALEITTDPPIEPSAWEATFDGETWLAATVDGTKATWLVAGPDYDTDTGTQAAYTTLPAGRTVPKLRAVDNPEVIVQNGPTIDVRP